jgi:bifunctional ADP-heptose synthase (sugar kinase/adenylyltransferase)
MVKRPNPTVAPLRFGDGLIAEEVTDLWDDCFKVSITCRISWEAPVPVTA